MRLEEHPVLEFRPGRKVVFTLDDQVLEGYEGEPVAMALEANGIKALRQSPVRGRPRGVFCAQGNCASCLMIVDGRPNV
ncbi:MAG TPA: (2Fe-2S)-binding protein, partial [Spirochaetia bacterium]|nr:(2Fe-2S)-binding protein [Spirochaetia bacterium]